MGVGTTRYAAIKVNQVRLKGEEWVLGSGLTLSHMSSPMCGPLSTASPPVLGQNKYTNTEAFLVRRCCEPWLPAERQSRYVPSSTEFQRTSQRSLLIISCSFPLIGEDFPSLIEALDDQKVEFLACGGSHTALLTTVRVSLSLR